MLPDSHHIRINNNKIHDASSSGIKSTENDYVSIINNEIFDNGKCSSDGAPGVLIENLRPIDTDPASEDTVKIGVINNQIHNNINNVPYFNENYSDPLYIINNNIDIPQNYPNYGTAANDDGYIIDGSGVKIVNDDDQTNANYIGRIEISHNEIANNGVNGIEINQVDNTQISDNVVAWNGMTSKDPPTERPDTSGIVIKDSEEVTLQDNEIFTFFADDVALDIDNESVIKVPVDGSKPSDSTKLCGGTISDNVANYVTAVGGNCAETLNYKLDDQKLNDFLAYHSITKTTDLPTTTLATTANPEKPLMVDGIVGEIPTSKTIYVDANNGQSYNDGLTLDAPKQTINQALDEVPETGNNQGITILVLNGEYSDSENFNSGNLNFQTCKTSTG